jgi:hypothetical protein
MNWFTKRNVESLTESAKKTLADSLDVCEHVDVDHKALFEVSYENDSFGREGYGMCHVCSEHQHTQVGLEVHMCTDCQKPFLKKDGVLWRWYDFYSAQGDQPIPVCGVCRALAKHSQRMKKDNDDYNREQGDDGY